MAVTQGLCVDALAWLRLASVAGLAPGDARKLVASFGDARKVLESAHGEIERVAGRAAAGALARGPDPRKVDAALIWASRPGRRILARDDPAFPKLLREIADPPLVLFATGRVELLDRFAIAIVGSRNATPQGMRDAEAFARALSEVGTCIVSGLAVGIDAAAHRGGLAASGGSVAVLGTGADGNYPPQNHALARRLGEEGCVITELALGTPPFRGNFPRRNRLISGLARGVLVVEAAPASGTLVTARSALDQGREVFAVPGSIHATHAKGCNALIRNGEAKLVEGAHHVLEEFGYRCAPAASTRDDGEPFLDAVGYEPVSVERIAGLTGLGAAMVAARLTRLELEGRIAALPGGLYQRIVSAPGRGGSPEHAL